MPTLQDELGRLKATGKIDGVKGGQHVGKVIDFHNQMEEKKRKKNFMGEINARNNYFLKMFMFKIEAIKSGKEKEDYKSSSILV